MFVCPHYGKDFRVQQPETSAAVSALAVGPAFKGTLDPFHTDIYE
jgi:hypothetical protein